MHRRVIVAQTGGKLLNRALGAAFEAWLGALGEARTHVTILGRVFARMTMAAAARAFAC